MNVHEQFMIIPPGNCRLLTLNKLYVLYIIKNIYIPNINIHAPEVCHSLHPASAAATHNLS